MANTGENSRWHSSQYRVYIYMVGHWPSSLSLIPGKSYKLRTNETCDGTGHDLFMYDIIHLDDIIIFFNMYFKIKEIMLKVVFFFLKISLFSPHITTCSSRHQSVI